MRLFIPILSVLLPGAAPQEGSGTDEDSLIINGCATVFFPAQYLTSFAAIDDFCSAVSDGLEPNFMQGCFHSCTGDGSPDETYLLDDDFQVDSIIALGFVQDAFDEDGNPMAQTKAYACADICVGLEADPLAVGPTEEDAAVFMKEAAKAAVIAGLEDTLGEPLSQFEMDSVAATTVNLETELIEAEASGDGEGEVTTVAPGPTEEPVASYSQCLSLYFPALWILQTMFSSIFNFCPVFEHKLCYAFTDVGAECWQHSCDTTCTGDGKPDVNALMDDDADAVAADEQTDGEHTCWKDNSLDSNYDAHSFGCFDVCFEIQASDSQLQQVIDNLGFSQRFLHNMEEWFETLAQEAVVEAMVAGPISADGSQDGGFPGGLEALATATQDSGAFDCNGAPCGTDNILDAGASTTFDVAAVEETTGRNCDDGLNGGCSHVCDGAGLNGVCSCPNECWELDVDGQSCTIPADKVQLSCQSDRMVAHLARCVVRDNNNFMLGNDNNCNEAHDEVMDMSNPIVGQTGACLPSTNITDPLSEGCVSFEVRLDECSTRVEADYGNNLITFTQNLVSEVAVHMQTGSIGTGAIISRAPRVSVEFTCEYRTDYETLETSAIVSPDVVENALESTGQFVFNLNTIVRDAPGGAFPGWSMYNSQSDPYMVGSTLYFEICAGHTLSNIYFSVPDCTVKNYNETESYKILDNHHLDVFVGTDRVGRQYDDIYVDWSEADTLGPFLPGTTTLSDQITNQCLVFSYTVFEFITSGEDDGDLRLTCNVHACNYDSDAPDDIVACMDIDGRKRRDTLMKETYYRVSMDIPIQHTDQV